MDSQLDHALIPILAQRLLALADDELILGHRDSEWCGHAPILEEDIAFANLALDELGHSNQWYALLAGLQGGDPDTFPDRLVYDRPAGEYRCAQLVELPNGDWAFSMLRQYLFDSAERLRLDRMVNSTYAPLAQTAAKIRKEELYHQRHTQAWVRRLGLGTEESHNRMQKALNELWPYASQLFAPVPGEGQLMEAGILPDPQAIEDDWCDQVTAYLKECDLTVDCSRGVPVSRDAHTQYLPLILADLQSLVKADPGAEW